MAALSAAALRVVMRQLQELHATPLDGIRLRHGNDGGGSDDVSEVHADIAGPVDTPFAGGSFHVCLVLGEGYPEAPPRGWFRTRVFHPNVSDRGEICVNTLKKDWHPSLGLRHVLMVIRCLLIEPNPESALNEEAGRLLLEDYGEFVRKARMHTRIHASGDPATPPPPAAVAPTTAPTTTTTTTTSAALKPVEGGANAMVAPGHALAASAAERKANEKKKAALKRL